MATETVKANALFDMASILKIDWTKKAGLDYFAKQGAQLSGGAVWANLSIGYYALGLAAKAAKTNDTPDHMPYFSAYQTARDKVPGQKPLSDDTAITYASVAKTLTELGHKLPYDGSTIMEYVAAKMGSVPYGSRAERISTIAAHFTTAPTVEEIGKFAATRWPKVNANLTDKASEIAEEVAAWEENDTFSPFIVKDAEMLAAYVALHSAAAAFLARSAIVAGAKTPKKAKAGNVNAAAIRAAIANANAKPNGASV